LSLSLGALCPNPLTTLLGTMVKAAVAAAVFPRNLRREILLLIENWLFG